MKTRSQSTFQVAIRSTQQLINKAVIILALIIGLNAPAFAQADTRLERLNLIFEGNLAGAVYVTHCDKNALTSYPVYIENARQTAEFLVAELMKQSPTPTQEQAIETLRNRQNQVVATLSDFYKKNGCETQQAGAAKKHFDLFNQMAAADMHDFLNNIEKSQ